MEPNNHIPFYMGLFTCILFLLFNIMKIPNLIKTIKILNINLIRNISKLVDWEIFPQ